MSHPSVESTNAAASVDWNVVGAALAVFCGTLVTTVWGWIKGKGKLKEHLKTDTTDIAVSGAVLQDNQTLREATLVNRELRDQLLVHYHGMASLCRVMEDMMRTNDDLAEELKKIRHLIDKGS